MGPVAVTSAPTAPLTTKRSTAASRPGSGDVLAWPRPAVDSSLVFWPCGCDADRSRRCGVHLSVDPNPGATSCLGTATSGRGFSVHVDRVARTPLDQAHLPGALGPAAFWSRRSLLPGAASGLGFAVWVPGKKNVVERPVRVVAGPVGLDGDLATPTAAQGVVLFAHGSGSGRHSPRNRQVASALGRAGFATLLLDLLTLEEEAADRASGRFRFNVELLAGRLGAAADWLAAEQWTAGLPVGLFGAGAGAALLAAAERPQAVAAVVSRGGRPDLAGAALGRVLAPTLLIVGALDPQVLKLNRAALGRLGSEASMEIVSGASHLFEEPGTLERVAELAVGWFTHWLAT